jgi:hypothetical protein
VFPNVFCMVPSCSHQVPNGYLFSSQNFLKVLNSDTLIPCVLPKEDFVNYKVGGGGFTLV